MKPRTLILVVLVLAGAGTCVRLGFWQLSRWEEKKASNVALRSSLAAAPILLVSPLPSVESIRNRRVELRGHYDETRQILLTGRGHDGEMGVSVVTPLLVGSDSAVLIERGWIPAEELSAVRPRDYPEPGARVVRGMALAIERGKPGPPLRVAVGDSITVLSMRVLHGDSVAAHVPYALAPFLVRELPGPGVPAAPRRLQPDWANEETNVSYAVQWFIIAGIILAGSAAMAWSRWRVRRPLASIP